ncbi:MAG: PadR family transcriptional regulator [Streptomycetaceae bacterium]|nr:PadR family transcriptional regulator [Streptomycetaceae bacterium]
MPPIFSHGRLRLYLLKLLADGPKHGYELMRLLQERFHGLYAPSAGSIYPRLAKLEAEGLVNRVEEGSRTAYTLTEKGRAELAARDDELVALDREIHTAVADLSGLADQIQEQVSGAVRSISRELQDQARQVRAGRGVTGGGKRPSPEVAELLARVEAFAVEARTLVARSRPGAPQARAVSATLDATLRTLRDLLR